jgi:hypothetical protein
VWLAVVGFIVCLRVLWSIPFTHEEIAAPPAAEGLDRLDLLLGLSLMVIGIVLFHFARKRVI